MHQWVRNVSQDKFMVAEKQLKKLCNSTLTALQLNWSWRMYLYWFELSWMGKVEVLFTQSRLSLAFLGDHRSWLEAFFALLKNWSNVPKNRRNLKKAEKSSWKRNRNSNTSPQSERFPWWKHRNEAGNHRLLHRKGSGPQREIKKHEIGYRIFSDGEKRCCLLDEAEHLVRRGGW